MQLIAKIVVLSFVMAILFYICIENTRQTLMRFIIISLSLLFFCYIHLSAQIKGVVVDMDTHKPLPYVKIKTDNKQYTATDYKGNFSIPAEFKSVSFTNISYLTREMNRAEMTDTIFLLPNTLNEVVIYGQDPYKIHFDLKSVGKPSIITGVRSPSGIDLLGWLNIFDRSVHHPSKREREKNKQIWDNY
jgi:hypothetical protein